MKNTFFAIFLASASSASFASQAVTINDLHNTKTSLDVVQDLNYKVTGSGVNGYGYTTKNDLFPIGPWIYNTATSGWLALSSNQGAGFPSTIYQWKTTFDLTGFDAKKASFSGRFAADDTAFIYLNGTQIGSSRSFTTWSSFASQPKAFVAGLNTLDFKVDNLGGGPTGLRVEFIKSSKTAVPEPGTCATLLAGLGLMGFMLRRRKSS